MMFGVWSGENLCVKQEKQLTISITIIQCERLELFEWNEWECEEWSREIYHLVYEKKKQAEELEVFQTFTTQRRTSRGISVLLQPPAIFENKKKFSYSGNKRGATQSAIESVSNEKYVCYVEKRKELEKYYTIYMKRDFSPCPSPSQNSSSTSFLRLLFVCAELLLFEGDSVLLLLCSFHNFLCWGLLLCVHRVSLASKENEMSWKSKISEESSRQFGKVTGFV